jgi:hypothetical protein
MDFLDPEDFTVGPTAEGAEQWQRFTAILDKAENYRSGR